MLKIKWKTLDSESELELELQTDLGFVVGQAREI